MAVGAMDAKLIETKQMEYATAINKRLQEEKGSALINFTNKQVTKGNNQYVFYIMDESTTGTGEFNMYADTYAGTGGATHEVSCTIDYVYAHDKIKRANMNSTSLDLKSPLIDSLVEALNRNTDKRILDVIAAKGFDADPEAVGKCVLVGDVTKAINDEANVNALIEAVAYMQSLAKSTSVNQTDVAIVVTSREYSKLWQAEKLINNDYSKFSSMLGDGGTPKLLGAELIKVPNGAKPDGVLLVARGSVGTASWENGTNSDSEWNMGQDAMFLMASRSLGAAVIDEKGIYKLQYLA